MRMKAIGLAALAVAAATLVQAIQVMAADPDKSQRAVSVSASGTVAAEPDVAYISTGVVAEAATAKEAIGANTAVMAKVIDGLKAQGIAARDMQTSALTVEARYTQPKDGRPASINGYRVLNQLRLTVREVKRLGEVLDAAIGLGANQVSGIRFDVAEPERLKDEARKQAMTNARRRAELYAAAAGVQLGEVLRIAEGVNEAGSDLLATRKFSGAAVPIEAGTRTLGVEVHVTYALK